MASKNSVLFIGISFILALLLSLSAASAYADYVNNASSDMTGSTVTSYGANIVIVQHLIEVDQVSHPGYFKVDETIVYKNIGAENYTGPIYSWVQDGAFNLVVAKQEMAMDGQRIPLQIFQADDNVVGWNDTILAGSRMPPMYRLEYMVPAEPTGKITESITFTKKLKYPTLVTYNYKPIMGMPVLVVKLMKSDEMKTIMIDGEGNKIEADSVEVGEDSRTYNWIQPPFTEISFKLSQSKIVSSEIILYLLIILVIIGVTGYPILRKKSPAIQGFEDRLGRIIPKAQDEDIYRETEEDEYEDEEIEEKDVEKESFRQPVLEKKDIENFDLDELKTAKKAVYKVLIELDEDYARGAISEDEYNTIRNKYKKKAIEILKQIDILEKKG